MRGPDDPPFPSAPAPAPVGAPAATPAGPGAPRGAPRIVPRTGPRAAPRIGLVLGGGGLKGFAHLGVLRALRERGIRPALVAGSSIGALLGAAHAAGMRHEELARRAAALRKRDLFRLDHYGVLMDRMRASSLYLGEPLRLLVEQVVPDVTFDALALPTLVNTVDIVRGTQVVWGMPGLRGVSVRDAVYASCALPGFFPPGRVDGRVCVDGGTVDNLPVSLAAHAGGAPALDAIVAVDVGNADLTHHATIHAEGFASIFMRSASIMMHALQEHPLARWEGPPMLLVRPRVSHIGWFAFGHTDALIEEGYRAACDALRDLDEVLTAPGGIFPRRTVRVTVDPERCTGCGLCVALAPRTMALDGRGKAYALTRDCAWSPADGDFVKQCPTLAIETTVVGGRTRPFEPAAGAAAVPAAVVVAPPAAPGVPATPAPASAAGTDAAGRAPGTPLAS